MDPIPHVTGAKYQDRYTIALIFSDGTAGSVDFEDWLQGPIFEPLRDEREFQRFFIEAGTIVWPNGADIAPETLYERAKANAGSSTRT